jgi:hypothetical protein
MKEAYLAKLETQLKDWERAVEGLKDRADFHRISEEWKTRRETAMKKLEELRSDTSDRWDVLKMGVESAWDELRTAFETATAKDMNKGDERAA